MTSEFCIAVHALVFLHHKGKCLSSEMLAKNICTNPARIRKIMAKLKKAKLVSTKEGADGGYLFCHSPEEVSLEQVAKAMDTAFVFSNWRSGNAGKNCFISSGMADVMDGIYQQLDQLCQDHLRFITIADVEKKLCNKSKA